MMELQWPWLLLTLPLPLLLRLLLPPQPPEQGAALQIPFEELFSDQGPAASGQQPANPRFARWLAALLWILLVAAASRPVWLGEPIELQISGRDLLLAVDLSGSMQTEDFLVEQEQVSRLEATKQVAGDFILRRSGDRIGLLLFGSQPYMQTPLTFDRTTVRRLLDEAAIGLAGDKTAIGEAIGLGVKRLKQRPAENRVLILLTDGANTAGAIAPEKAARFAHQAGVTIYTVGIGADSMLVSSFFGTRRVNPSADLDEPALRQIAQLTGGRYFRARDSRELAEIYELIDQLEPVLVDQQFFRPKSPLYCWPLGAALVLALGLLFLRGRP
ncbi:vWA domain-containing protein [Desulfogranum mediterraneum]|uniref:vWA domain-containing protein n=1 Tax=Desulfogranum mediterraneum TaxID=160661 RepID=UPI00040517DA|nr:VWA domain-containing protein [Desulfogranum mediterraneum]